MKKNELHIYKTIYHDLIYADMHVRSYAKNHAGQTFRLTGNTGRTYEQLCSRLHSRFLDFLPNIKSNILANLDYDIEKFKEKIKKSFPSLYILIYEEGNDNIILKLGEIIYSLDVLIEKHDNKKGIQKKYKYVII